MKGAHVRLRIFRKTNQRQADGFVRVADLMLHHEWPTRAKRIAAFGPGRLRASGGADSLRGLFNRLAREGMRGPDYSAISRLRGDGCAALMNFNRKEQHATQHQ
jgi:hypothetical protein